MASITLELLTALDAERELNRTLSRQNAEQISRALRDRLEAEETFAQQPDAQRFRVVGGRVSIPDRLGWIGPNGPARPEALLSPIQRLQWRSARAEPDPAKRGARLRSLLDSLDDGSPGTPWLLSQLAITEHRIGSTAQSGVASSVGSGVGSSVEPPPESPGQRSAPALERLLNGLDLTTGTDPVVRWLSTGRAVHPSTLGSLLVLDLQQRTGARLLTATSRRRLVEDFAHRAAPSLVEALRVRLREFPRTSSDELIAFEIVASEAQAWRSNLLFAAAAPLADTRDDRGIRLIRTPGSRRLILRTRDRGIVLDGPEELLSLVQGLMDPEERDRLTLGTASYAGTVDVLPPVLGLMVDDNTPAESTLAVWAGRLALPIALVALLFAGLLLVQRTTRSRLESARLRTEFVTNVTHELKTPLAGIQLVSEMLEDESMLQRGERRQWSGRLREEIGRLGLLIDNVLDLGRAESTHWEPIPEIDLEREVEDLATTLGPWLASEGLELELRFPERLPSDRRPDARIRPETLRSVLRNLCDNARKYASEGRRVRLEGRVDQKAGMHRVTVRDYGPGLRELDHERVFDRFARSREHQESAKPGLGLGLHLAREMMRKEGCELRSRTPAEGSGALFELEIPVAHPA